MFYGMNGQELLGTWESAEDAVETLLRMTWKHLGHVCFRIAYNGEAITNGASIHILQTKTTRYAKMIDVVWHDSDEGPKIESFEVFENRINPA